MQIDLETRFGLLATVDSRISEYWPACRYESRCLLSVATKRQNPLFCPWNLP
jgi:hypothetical protein